MKITLSGALHAGEVDLLVSEVAEECPQMFENVSLLVVVLDSNRSLPGWLPGFLREKERNLETRIVANAVLVPSEGVGWLRTLLDGFDEFYVLPPGWSERVEQVPSFTVDGCSFGEGVPTEFQSFFDQIGALRYFTDGAGFGTNYCVRDGLDAASLERAEVAVRNRRQ